METTYTTPNVGAGTSENVVPEGLRKLGRIAVWAVSGSQFIDLIWREHGYDEPSRDGPAAAPRGGERLSQAELADLIRRAEPKRSPVAP